MNTSKNWRNFIIGFATAAVVSFGGYAAAQETADPDQDCKDKHSYHHHKGERSFPHMADVLQLTEEQKQTLTAHKEEQRVSYREHRQQIRQTQRALHQAVANSAGDAEVTELAERLGDLTAQQTIARAKEKQFLLSILTPEQKEKMEQMRSERKNRWKEKRSDSEA